MDAIVQTVPEKAGARNLEQIGEIVRTKFPKLSPQESRALAGVTQGMANKEIARKLGITEATVKVHVKAVLRVLGVDNRTKAALIAVRQGVPFYGGSAVAKPSCPFCGMERDL